MTCRSAITLLLGTIFLPAVAPAQERWFVPAPQTLDLPPAAAGQDPPQGPPQGQVSAPASAQPAQQATLPDPGPVSGGMQQAAEAPQGPDQPVLLPETPAGFSLDVPAGRQRKAPPVASVLAHDDKPAKPVQPPAALALHAGVGLTVPDAPGNPPVGITADLLGTDGAKVQMSGKMPFVNQADPRTPVREAGIGMGYSLPLSGGKRVSLDGSFHVESNGSAEARPTRAGTASVRLDF